MRFGKVTIRPEQLFSGKKGNLNVEHVSIKFSRFDDVVRGKKLAKEGPIRFYNAAVNMWVYY